jgi:hypothetical protein
VDEVTNETASQSVVAVEVPNLQIDSSDKDKSSKGDETPSSEMTMVMNLMQQLLQRTEQQFQGLEKRVKQAQEKTEESVKQAQEKTGQQFQEGLKEFQELKNGQKQALEKTD